MTVVVRVQPKPDSFITMYENSDSPVGGISSSVSSDITASVIEFLQAGGPVVAILLAMSLAALAIVFVKLLQFRAAALGDRRTASEALALWEAGSPERSERVAAGSPNPVAQALARGLRGQRLGLSESRIREEVLRYGGDVLADLRAWFRPLEVIASLAPLLGLFGTVLGMIQAFQQMEQAGSQINPAILSGGIWQALLTTAVGLAVAIPVVAALNWLERRVDRLAHDMDSAVTRLFTDDLSPDSPEPGPEHEHNPGRLRTAAATGH